MTFRTILVHLNDERRLPAMLDVAIPIALANKAHLVGLAVLPPVVIVPDMDVVAGTAIDEHRVEYAAHMRRMRETFLATTSERKVDASWEELDGQVVNPFGTVANVVVGRARSVDLVIDGQTNTDWAYSGLLDVAEQLITESGRPVLLVPKSAGKGGSAKRVLVAWNGSREATRAVFDALPLLVNADEVMVTSLDHNVETKGNTALSNVDICVALARHGVKCTALKPDHQATGVGSTLLSMAQQHGAGLLVMGCYGHSRLREFMLGGATRYVLEHMTLPVVMSH